ncbi:hypothetical protein C27AD_15524 [Salinisphaera hydrothermalis C27AD]
MTILTDNDAASCERPMNLRAPHDALDHATGCYGLGCTDTAGNARRDAAIAPSYREPGVYRQRRSFMPMVQPGGGRPDTSDAVARD